MSKSCSSPSPGAPLLQHYLRPHYEDVLVALQLLRVLHAAGTPIPSTCCRATWRGSAKFMATFMCRVACAVNTGNAGKNCIINDVINPHAGTPTQWQHPPPPLPTTAPARVRQFACSIAAFNCPTAGAITRERAFPDYLYPRAVGKKVIVQLSAKWEMYVASRNRRSRHHKVLYVL